MLCFFFHCLQVCRSGATGHGSRGPVYAHGYGTIPRGGGSAYHRLLGFFWFRYASHGEIIIPSWRPERKVLWRGISWPQSKGAFYVHEGDQEQMGSVRVRPHMAAGTPRRVRLPVSFGILLTGDILISSWSGAVSYTHLTLPTTPYV